MTPSDEEKKAVWEAYRAGRPTRVPMTLAANPRVVLLDPAWNPHGWTFKDYWTDPRILAETQLKFLEYQVEFLWPHTDNPTQWPKKFGFWIDVQNVYDSAYFGGPLEFRDGQVPDVSAIYSGKNKERVFEVDIDHPLDNPFVRQTLARYEAVKMLLPSLSFRGLELSLAPATMGFDGPLTIATNLRGSELYTDLYEDRPYVDRLLEFLTRGAIIRNVALQKHFGQKPFDAKMGSMADDSAQLISTAMFRQAVLPWHRLYLAQYTEAKTNLMHLCGDATRHFLTIRDELNVSSFDTGFPVDFGWLRQTLGPQVEIMGGPEVSLLRSGTPEAVYERTQSILQSGIMAGGRFLLKEANNLPPGCPAANLAAMYRACLEHGWYR